jgi:hypothetical protein
LPAVDRSRHATVTIRYAFPDDARPLARLAALDSSPVPRMPMLVAEVDGELRVALSLADGAVVGDPFHPIAGLTELLRARAEQLAGGRRTTRNRLRIALRPVLGHRRWL